jgi:NADPH:quinone reductase-like Zn-dependent oxidoreductase
LGNIRAAKVTSGQDVLVYGATGAIGSAAVQLLKYFGANVSAVCNTQNVEVVKSLGADQVVDYMTQDYTKIDQKFDLFFDAVGKSSFGKCKPLLKEHGIYISTELGKNSENIFLALLTPLSKGKKVLFPLPTISKDDVVFLKKLVESGHFKPLIDRSYNLDDIVDAYKYVETRQKVGNVVISIQHSALSTPLSVEYR